MKAYFSVIGIGLGHASRSISIANELNKMGVESVFSTYGKAAKLTSELDFKTYRSKQLMWYEDENGHLDYERTLLKSPLLFYRMAQHYKDERERIIKEDPDIIISDSRYSIIPASITSDVPRIYITNQPRIYMPHPNNGSDVTSTPLERIGCWWNYNLLSGQDKIIIPDFPMPESIAYRHMLFDGAPEDFKNKTEFVGPIAPHRPSSIREDDVKETCKKYGVEPGDFIYIAFSGPGKIKKEIKDSIFNLFPDYELPTIMGTGKPGDFKIHTKGNLKLVDGWIKEREELMSASKLIVSRAGLCTLSEIAAFGKKAVVIPQANQPEQESNAQGVQNLGFAKKIDPNKINSDLLERSITELIESVEVGDAAREYRKKSKEWKGESKSAKIIYDYMNEN